MIEWRDHADAGALAAAVVSDVGSLIEQAIAARNHAVVALPGGRSPLAAFERLARAKLDWGKVTVIPGDDRLVGADDPLSNYAVLARCFTPAGARVVPLAAGRAADHRAAGADADRWLAGLPWPLDLVWLGVGADGHTASIFPGPDLDDALDAPADRRAVGLLPDPPPSDAPVARVTLTRGAIAAARTVILTLAGDAKRAVIEQAIEEGESSAYPVGRVLAAVARPILYWSPA